MRDIGVILKALDFAARRHRNQFRKGSDKVPYINHPIQVANLLVNEAGEKDSDLVASAILHDVIEDTVESVEERQELICQMSSLFNKEIIYITLEVTDDKTLEKKERKKLQIEEASHKSIKAKKLKIADKIMNLRDIHDNPPSDWPLERIIEYLDWSEKVVAGLRGVNSHLEQLFDESLLAARSKYQHNNNTLNLKTVRTNSDNSDFKELVKLLDAELKIVDGEDHAFYSQFNKIYNIKYVVVIYENNKPIACGAIKEYSKAATEIKRMFVLSEKRNRGIASMILRELEKWAAEMSYKKCVLETGKRQPEAIGLYRKNGYLSIPNYGQYAGIDNSVCFEKELK
jgi:putative acetyltransferase